MKVHLLADRSVKSIYSTWYFFPPSVYYCVAHKITRFAGQRGAKAPTARIVLRIFCSESWARGRLQP